MSSVDGLSRFHPVADPIKLHRHSGNSKHGLLDDPATIGTRQWWQARLDAAGFALRGHRLVRRGVS